MNKRNDATPGKRVVTAGHATGLVLDRSIQRDQKGRVGIRKGLEPGHKEGRSSGGAWGVKPTPPGNGGGRG